MRDGEGDRSQWTFDINLMCTAIQSTFLISLKLMFWKDNRKSCGGSQQVIGPTAFFSSISTFVNIYNRSLTDRWDISSVSSEDIAHSLGSYFFRLNGPQLFQLLCSFLSYFHYLHLTWPCATWLSLLCCAVLLNVVKATMLMNIDMTWMWTFKVL